MIRSLGFGLDRSAEPQPVDSAAVKLIKRGTEYDILKNRCSGVSDAIDEALVALEHSGYIALPADYSRPNAEWGTLNDIEKRGCPEYQRVSTLFQPNFGVFGIDLSGGGCWGLPMSNPYSHPPSKRM